MFLMLLLWNESDVTYTVTTMNSERNNKLLLLLLHCPSGQRYDTTLALYTAEI